MKVDIKLLALFIAASGCRHAGSPSSLEGLWSTELSGLSDLPTRVYLTQVQGGLRVTADDFQSAATIEGQKVFGDLPGRLRFRGQFSSDQRSITGFLIQPEDTWGGQVLATPVHFELNRPRLWEAELRPLRRNYRIYLDIFRETDGLRAVIRNPERNLTGGATGYAVIRNAQGWTLRGQRWGRSVELTLEEGEGEDELKLHFPPLGQVLRLKRTAKQSAGAYRSHVGPPEAGGLSPFARLDDGWETANPEHLGFDPARLRAMVARLRAADPRAKRPELLHSLLVARAGKLVLEEYFFGYSATDPHDIRSAGKTFSSILLGALMAQNLTISPETKALGFLKDYASAGPPAAAKENLTLGHLMTHTSGLDCYDGDEDSPGTEWRMWTQREELNFWLFTANLPAVAEPGTRYAYCSGGMNLVGAALAHVSGQSVLELIDRLLAQPLGFGPYYWNLMPNGEAYLGGGAFLRPRDLLKVGQLYLDGGKWRGTQVLSPSWIQDSTAPRARITPETTGLDPERFSNFYFGGVDGYAWHLNDIVVDGRTYPSFEANGNGGQLLIVVPDLSMTVVMTGGNYGQGAVWGQWRDRILGGAIIPALSSNLRPQN